MPPLASHRLRRNRVGGEGVGGQGLTMGILSPPQTLPMLALPLWLFQYPLAELIQKAFGGLVGL